MLTLEIDVLGRQFMSSRTMESGDRDLSGAHFFHALRRDDWSKAAPDVDASGNGFEVIGVDATGNAAEMVDLQSFRDRPLGVFVSEAVRRNTGAASPGGDSSVVAAYHAFPYPTAAKRNGNATLKQFVERSGEMLQSGHSLWSFTGGSLRSGMSPASNGRRRSVSTMERAHG
jgi:hypothetical protein